MAIVPRLLAEESINITVASVLKEREQEREGGREGGKEGKKKRRKGGNLLYDIT